MNEIITVPDIGGAKDVDVIDILVKPGDVIQVEDLIVTLEGDKATMDVPSPYAGTVKALKIKVGDKVSAGSAVLLLEVEKSVVVEVIAEQVAKKEIAPESMPEIYSEKKPQEEIKQDLVYASPAVRRMAREFDIDLTVISGTGEKGRITKADLQQHVKARLQGAVPQTLPQIDFSLFGAVSYQPLTKIQKLSGAHLHRNWVSIPHVTQFGEVDITELEAFRKEQKARTDTYGVRLTPLVFIMKAVVAALQAFPHFNASLDPSGEQLILKKYFHIGVAVDTPKGLVVPVIQHVDQKGIVSLAQELSHISAKARDKGLSMTDMQGGSFSISSLGGIGGTAFTPIINAPEVAILGVSRAVMKPVYQEGKQGEPFIPRLMLPISLSYDHRVIDGADGARFLMHLSASLADIRVLLF